MCLKWLLVIGRDHVRVFKACNMWEVGQHALHYIVTDDGSEFLCGWRMSACVTDLCAYMTPMLIQITIRDNNVIHTPN